MASDYTLSANHPAKMRTYQTDNRSLNTGVSVVSIKTDGTKKAARNKQDGALQQMRKRTGPKFPGQPGA